MAQRLQIGKGWVTVKRIFMGAQGRARQQVIDGHVVTVHEATPAPPEIVEGTNGGFYYKGEELKPVTDPAHVQHLPNKDAEGRPIPGSHLARALAWIEAQKERPAKPLMPTTKREAGAAVRASRGRSRRRKRPLVVKDPKTLAQATGGVQIETEKDADRLEQSA